MDIRGKAAAFIHEVHIAKEKKRLIVAGILFVLLTGVIGASIWFDGFEAKDFAIMAGLAAASLLIYMVDMPVFWLIKAAILLFIPYTCFYTFETLTHDMSYMIDVATKLNIAFYYWVYIFLFIIIGRSRISMSIGTLFFAIIGITNYFVVLFRSSPIVPWDLFSIETAAGVADNYSLEINAALAKHVCMFVLMYVLGLKLALRVKLPGLRAALAIAALIPAYFYISYLWQDDLERKTGLNDTVFNTSWMQKHDGFFVSFIVDLHYLQLEEPDGYSEDKALSLLEEQDVETVETPETLPNIIVIMNESFSDPAVLGDFETNQDYMPFIHSILSGEVENTISGYTYVSVLGGNTANSEFEFLTGNTMAFFPNGSVPYLQYVKNGVSTIVDQLNDLGYDTYGTHPYRAKGWNRQTIYQLMGFDHMAFLGDFPSEKKLRKYVSDEADFNSILKWMDKSDGPFFMFNVTMQNHSNYGGDYDNFDPKITASFKHTKSNKYLNKYLSLIYETDTVLEKFISTLAESDEPTVVVFYGDHQPNDYVVKPIYKEYGLDFDNQSLEQSQQRQKTPYFIWANYDIEEKTNYDISLNYLNVLLFDTVGFQLDEYQTFRKSLWQGDIPIMNALGYIDENGNIVDYDDATDEVQSELDDYKTIQYYRMEGEYKSK